MSVELEKEPLEAQQEGFAEALPEVRIRRQRWPSPVWVIPLAAALVGLWLLFQYWLQQGEVVTVRFPSAEGIEAGVTQVRYKAVTVGKVKSVTLDDKLNPLVTLALSKEISGVLGCSAQFWVVRPRVRGAEISGLGTLFSGTYVGMVPLQEEETEASRQSVLCYEVLDAPPVSKPDRPGREYLLLTESMGSLDVGTPIYYKQLQVGEVYNYRLSAATGKVELGVFIDDPYYRFINGNTRFWNVSGMKFKMDSAGAEFQMESLSALLVGGVAFDTPRDQSGNLAVAAPGARFDLYPDLASSREKYYDERLYYTLYFDGSVRGLSEDAPVEFQGIRVGKVEKIKMYLDTTSMDMRIPVLISVEPQRFSEDITLKDAPALMEGLVGHGMRAKLKSGNLLTGQMYVSLGFEDKAKPEQIAKGQFYDVFPTSPTPVEELSRMAVGVAEDVKAALSSVRRFMESDQLDKTVANANKVLLETELAMKEARKAVVDARQVIQALSQETLPTLNKNVDQVSGTLTRSLNSVTGNMEKVTGTLNHSLTSVTGNVEKVTGTLNRSLTGITSTAEKAGNSFSRSSLELDKTMQRLQNSLTHLDRLMAQNSPTQTQLMEMMEEVTAVSQSVRALSDELRRQPESLLRGRR